MSIILKMQNIMLKTNTCSNTVFTWLSSERKQLLENLYFEFLHPFSFSCIWNKEAICCRWNTMTFRHNIAYIVN